MASAVITRQRDDRCEWTSLPRLVRKQKICTSASSQTLDDACQRYVLRTRTCAIAPSLAPTFLFPVVRLAQDWARALHLLENNFRLFYLQMWVPPMGLLFTDSFVKQSSP